MAEKTPERRGALTRLRHPYGQLEGVDGAGRIGLSGARQVEGGSVVRAQPGTGKAQRDIHGGMEVHQFQRNQPLVMVWGQHGVIVPFHGVPVHAVRNGRTVKFRVRMNGPQPFYGRGNNSSVLVAEGAVFPGVGVQGRQGDAPTW